MKLSKDYYLQEDVVSLARDLLGKCLFTKIEGKLTAGTIVETEAYIAPDDRASHAYNYKKTARTKVFYEEGGLSYVYLCYGIHHLFNIITNKKDVPHAILVRAVEPVEGVDIMASRRKKCRTDYCLTAGPGALSAALGINKVHNGVKLTGDEIWLEDRGIKIARCQVISSPRVGIDYAGEWALKPLRFRIKGNPWTSKAK